MITDEAYASAALQKERSIESLAHHNFQRLDKIYQAGRSAEDHLFETVLTLKILRMKKVMAKHGRIILTRDQAGEIWKGSK
jgi:hypothetical protein